MVCALDPPYRGAHRDPLPCLRLTRLPRLLPRLEGPHPGHADGRRGPPRARTSVVRVGLRDRQPRVVALPRARVLGGVRGRHPRHGHRGEPPRNARPGRSPGRPRERQPNRRAEGRRPNGRARTDERELDRGVAKGGYGGRRDERAPQRGQRPEQPERVGQTRGHERLHASSKGSAASQKARLAAPRQLARSGEVLGGGCTGEEAARVLRRGREGAGDRAPPHDRGARGARDERRAHQGHREHAAVARESGGGVLERFSISRNARGRAPTQRRHHARATRSTSSGTSVRSRRS